MRARIVGSRGWGASSLAAALALLACEPTPCVEVPCLSDAEPVSRDAGLDAFAPDARRAAIDAGRDAAPYGEERWVPIGGLPADCVIETALEPEALPIEVGWEPCGEGCERWTGPNVVWGRPDAADLVWIRADRVLGLLDLTRASFRRALRTPTRGACTMFGDIDAGRVVLAVAHRPEATTDWMRLYDLAPEDPWPRLRVHAPLEDDGFVIALRAGGPRLAFATTQATWTLDPHDSAVRLAANASRDPLLGVVGTDVFFAHGGYDVPFAFAVAPFAGTPRTLHETRQEVTGIAVDDGTLAWVEITSAGAGLDWTGELWTATYDGSTFTARLVRGVSAGAGAALGAGLYGRAEDSPRGYRDLAVFYRLTDGARAIFPLADSAAAGVVSIRPDSALLAAGFRIDPRTLVFE